MKNIQKLEEWIYLLDSWIAWPTISILWWVHGDETCWVEVLDFLQENIDVKIGKLFLIYGNLEAIDQWTRQVEQNLNRMFQNERKYSEQEKETYEYSRAQVIKKYLDQSLASLDLHSSPSEWSPAFVICENNAFEIIRDFPFVNICSGFDKVEPGWTDYYMNSTWKIWICVECGNHNAADAMQNALISTREFLQNFDMILEESLEKINKKLWTEGIYWDRSKNYFMAKKAYITKTTIFTIAKQFKDFEVIESWQVIWYDWGIGILAENKWNILFGRSREQSWVEGFIEIIWYQTWKNTDLQQNWDE